MRQPARWPLPSALALGPLRRRRRCSSLAASAPLNVVLPVQGSVHLITGAGVERHRAGRQERRAARGHAAAGAVPQRDGGDSEALDPAHPLHHQHQHAAAITWAATPRSSRRRPDAAPAGRRSASSGSTRAVDHRARERAQPAVEPAAGSRPRRRRRCRRRRTSSRRWTSRNGEAIVLYHQPAAHTDGDSVVLFRGSDVISTGAIFTPGRYPVIDLARGGSVQGLIAALDQRPRRSPCPKRSRRAARRSFPATGASPRRPTSPSSATWSSSSATACRI